MTMQHPIHPDDERLAALAGDDADATADAGLREHVSGCDRCGPMVAELRQLRAALAQLPDMVPSRPLQLVPPVAAAEPRPATGWLRRMAAPMVAAGAGLVFIGVVGTSGVLSGFSMGLGAAAASAGDLGELNGGAGQPAASSSGRNLSGGGQPTQDSSGEFGGASRGPIAHPPTDRASEKATGGTASPHPVETPARESDQPGGTLNPWAIVLLAGALMVFVGGVALITQPVRGP
jgi:hypothetical protein